MKRLIFILVFSSSFAFALDFGKVYHNFMGKRAYEKQDFASSEKSFGKSIAETDRKSGISHFNLGDSFYKQGKFDEALSQYSLALLDKDFPNKSYAYQNIGNAYFKKGELDKAKKSYIEAIREDPSNYQARTNLEIAEKLLQEQQKQQNHQNQQSDQQQEDKKKDEQEQKKENKQEQSKKSDEQKKQEQKQQNSSEEKDNKKNEQQKSIDKKKQNNEDEKKQKKEAIKKNMADKKIDKILNQEKMLRLQQSKQKGEVPINGKYW